MTNIDKIPIPLDHGRKGRKAKEIVCETEILTSGTENYR
jgi:hypothetical protein